MEECHATYVIRHVPMILHKILEPLPSKSLNACSRVSKEWNEFATEIKRTRKQIEWLSLECTEDNDIYVIAEKIKNFTEQLLAQPQHVFLFCTTSLYERPIRIPSTHPERHQRRAKCEVMEIGEFLNKLLPKTCSLLAVSGDGVIGTTQKTNKTTEMEDTEALTILSLPKIQGLDIYTFFVNINTYANRMDENATGVFDVNQVSTVPEDKEVKAILFFCNEPYCPPEIGYTLLQHYKGCVIAGGYVDNLISPDKCSHDDVSHSEASLMCIALCGPKVRVVSIVIKEEVNTEAEVDKLIKKLKDCNLPEEKSFAFLFACIGRGRAHFKGTENVESSVFRKYFPKTPLFGFFGNGEVGFDYLQKYSKDMSSVEKPSSQPSNKPLPKLYHAYTSIICLVSIT